MTSIEVVADAVSKSYRLRSGLFSRRDRGSFVAVRGLSFEICKGQCVGLIGPNGAGKSTTIKMLSGILLPSAGAIRVCGLNPVANRVDNALNIGTVFGNRSQLWWDLPLMESFKIVAAMYGLSKEQFQKNLARLSELLGIRGFIRQPVRTLSLGQRMRGELVAANLHEPKVLFLDEPTIGLDVVARERIREFIEYLKEQASTTVILTTHEMADVERLCQRIMLMDCGTKLFDGTTSQLRLQFPTRSRCTIVLCETPNSDPLVGMESVESKVIGNRLEAAFDRDRYSVHDILLKVSSGHRIVDVTTEGETLEDVVRRIYENRETAFT